jgi:hypothetical protein
MSSKKQPIDPICALCRISLLNFKGINTKIGINGHAINIQDSGTIQSIMRIYNGDGKEDLFELFYVVTHLIAWFLVPIGKDTNHSLKVDERFKSDLSKMIKYMCIGLRKLQSTYQYGNVVLAIQYYINLLEDGLKGSFDTERLPHCLIEDLWIESPLKTKVTELWDYERLHRVCTIFDDCFAESDKNSKFKVELINGYLLSIENILATYEKEFNSNIKQWG